MSLANIHAPNAEAPRSYEVDATFRAMGTDWRIAADGVRSAEIGTIRQLVEVEEQRCSRFRPTSTLSKLNLERQVADPALAEIVRRGLRFSRSTAGAFDLGVGDAVIASGYDRTFEAISTGAIASPVAGEVTTVSVDGDHVWLDGGGSLDLGGIAKGWTADRVGHYLRSTGAARWLVEAGGDVLIGGRDSDLCEELIAVEYTGYTIGLEEGAVATSSTLRRAWSTQLGPMHHIIAPGTARPARGEYVLATVRAADATTADALATALLADTPSAIPALAAFEAEALLVDEQGAAVMTPGLERYLR
jgi:thiamine biosynthesis lipoprotein